MNKQSFNLWLQEHPRFWKVGGFMNEFMEEFVVYGYSGYPHYLYITGDELGWRPKLLWMQGREVGKNFLLSIDELVQALHVIKDYLSHKEE